ncbi:hypothetical protein D3C71_1956410 [compost metagenome]
MEETEHQLASDDARLVIELFVGRRKTGIVDEADPDSRLLAAGVDVVHAFDRDARADLKRPLAADSLGKVVVACDEYVETDGRGESRLGGLHP